MFQFFPVVVRSRLARKLTNRPSVRFSSSSHARIDQRTAGAGVSRLEKNFAANPLAAESAGSRRETGRYCVFECFEQHSTTARGSRLPSIRVSPGVSGSGGKSSRPRGWSRNRRNDVSSWASKHDYKTWGQQFTSSTGSYDIRFTIVTVTDSHTR